MSFFISNIFKLQYFQKKGRTNSCCLSQKQVQLPIIIRCGLLFILQIFFTIIDYSFWVLLTERGPSSRSERSYRLKDLQPTFSNRFFSRLLVFFLLLSDILVILMERFSVCRPIHHKPPDNWAAGP